MPQFTWIQIKAILKLIIKIKVSCHKSVQKNQVKFCARWLFGVYRNLKNHVVNDSCVYD